MDISRFRRILLQVFLLPVVTLLVLAGALYLGIQSSNITVNLIQQSDERIREATEVGKLILDEETGL